MEILQKFWPKLKFFENLTKIEIFLKFRKNLKFLVIFFTEIEIFRKFD